MIISSRKPDACRNAQETLSEFGEVEAIACDVRDPARCEALVEEVAGRTDQLDILVKCSARASS